MRPIKWAYGTIALAGENVVIVQNNIRKRLFRKAEQMEIRTEYPLRTLIGIDVSGDDKSRWLVLRARGRNPGGWQGISDHEALLELAEYLSTWIPVTWDGEVWQKGQTDVRASASPIGAVTPGGERRALKCSLCGGPVEGRARFCPSCGAALV